MKAYSLDLRQKILRACAQLVGSQRTMAALFGVSQSCIETLWRRRRTTGEISPRSHAGGRNARGDAAALAGVHELLQAQSDATREELCARLHAQRGLRVSVPTLSRLVTSLGRPRKNSRSTPASGTPRVQQARQAYRQGIAALDYRHLKCVDASGVNVAMPRLYGRAPTRARVAGSVPQNYGQHETMRGP